jgi:hypothetical protein
MTPTIIILVALLIVVAVIFFAIKSQRSTGSEAPSFSGKFTHKGLGQGVAPAKDEAPFAVPPEPRAPEPKKAAPKSTAPPPPQKQKKPQPAAPKVEASAPKPAAPKPAAPKPEPVAAAPKVEAPAPKPEPLPAPAPAAPEPAVAAAPPPVVEAPPAPKIEAPMPQPAAPQPAAPPPPAPKVEAPKAAPPPAAPKPAAPPVVPAAAAPPGPTVGSAASPTAELEEADKRHKDARRLARLLVSEIKLYNENAVNQGRANKDLYTRLKKDIDRSMDVFMQRVPEEVRNHFDYLHDELVRQLAEGDSSKLGANAPQANPPR